VRYFSFLLFSQSFSEKDKKTKSFVAPLLVTVFCQIDDEILIHSAADILASPAAMQIRQLEALQNMARQGGSGSSKVIFGMFSFIVDNGLKTDE